MKLNDLLKLLDCDVRAVSHFCDVLKYAGAFHIFLSLGCSTLNIRQKTIQMTRRLNYPLTWRYNRSQWGIAAMWSLYHYISISHILITISLYHILWILYQHCQGCKGGHLCTVVPLQIKTKQVKGQNKKYIYVTQMVI